MRRDILLKAIQNLVGADASLREWLVKKLFQIRGRRFGSNPSFVQVFDVIADDPRDGRTEAFMFFAQIFAHRYCVTINFRNRISRKNAWSKARCVHLSESSYLHPHFSEATQARTAITSLKRR